MTELLESVGLVARRVEAAHRDGEPVRVVVAQRTYPAEIDDVWDACTNPERLPRWFLPVSGELRPGGRYQFDGNAGGVVERCDRPTRIGVTWEYAGDVSWLELRLSPAADGGTTLQLRHAARVDQKRWAEFGPGAVGVGWDLGLMGLGQHFAENATVTPESAQAWLSSAEGREFMARSSADWCRAAIEAGEDPAAAEAAAARTTQAYLGSPSADSS